jgi:hypothetical protein
MKKILDSIEKKCHNTEKDSFENRIQVNVLLERR